jgi:hypothetical protein
VPSNGFKNKSPYSLRLSFMMFQLVFTNSNDLFWHIARVWKRRALYTVVVGKLEGKRPLGRPRRRWVDVIKLDIQ